MRSLIISLCLLALASPLLTSPLRAGEPNAAQSTAKPFELLDGDRVVFVGGTFFEREGKFGYIETALTSRFPDRNVTFRNLGYAGDTVRCEARTVCEGWANFGPPEEGFDRLKKLIAEIKPTVAFINYGMGESFEGEKALPQFVQDYGKLLDMLTEASGGKPRFVLIGPNYHEDMGRPLPEPAEHNKLLRVYSDAIGKIAGERGARFIDFYTITENRAGAGPVASGRPLTQAEKVHLTDDGIQIGAGAYWHCAMAIEQALGYPPRSSEADLDAAGDVKKEDGVQITEVKAGKGILSFSYAPRILPWTVRTPIWKSDKFGEEASGTSIIRIKGLPLNNAGEYALKLGDKSIEQYDAFRWGEGVWVNDAWIEQTEHLRKLIVAKNADYFNNWRHENDTYILGYRKHEQGKNAVEFPEFVKLAEEKEKEIAKLRVPRPVTYTLVREEKTGK